MSEEATPAALRLSDELGAEHAPIVKPARRWDGSRHSAAHAISAAVRMLQAEDPITCAPTMGELVSICSELVFRATGERIRPVLDSRTMNLETSIVQWHDCQDWMPDDGRQVLVRLQDGDIDFAHHDGEYGWASDHRGGVHPGHHYTISESKQGRRTVRKEVERITPVVAWADLPQTAAPSA